MNSTSALSNVLRYAIQKLRNISSSEVRHVVPELTTLVDLISLEDVRFDRSILNSSAKVAHNQGWENTTRERAPVTYVHICEDQGFSAGVFIVKEGFRLPLHDHPNMHGIIKVIHGAGKIKHFSETQSDIPESIKQRVMPFQRPRIKCVDVGTEIVVNTSSKPCVLTPRQSNLHEIVATNGSLAFFDILFPPYDHENGTRVCKYYKKIGTAEDERAYNMQFLLEIPTPPDFWCDSLPLLD